MGLHFIEHKRRAALALSGLMLLATACGSIGGPVSAATKSGGLPEKATPNQVQHYVAKTLKGKTVDYAAGAIGNPLETMWMNTFKTSFEQLGMKFKGNQAAGTLNKLVQNVQLMVSQKPNVLIINNQDLTDLESLIKQAQKQGTYVILINLASIQQSDAFVGGDFVPAQTALAQNMASACTAKGEKQVAILTGWTGDALSAQASAAYRAVFKKAGIQVVSQQPTNYLASTANQVAKTVMQQYPNLCGFIGTWDEMTIGAADAVQAAGKAGQVLVYTNDASQVACQALQAGTMQEAVDYGAEAYGPAVIGLTEYLLESGVKPGSHRTALLMHYKLITKATMSKDPAACYNGTAF